jgi:hypothetical protein
MEIWPLQSCRVGSKWSRSRKLQVVLLSGSVWLWRLVAAVEAARAAWVAGRQAAMAACGVQCVLRSEQCSTKTAALTHHQ